MDINWQDPKMVSLHQRLAAAAQQEYEDSLMDSGRVADPEHLGARTASAILTAAIRAEFSGAGWSVTFRSDPAPSRNVVIGCVYCEAKEGELHTGDCSRGYGVLRGRGHEVTL